MMNPGDWKNLGGPLDRLVLILGLLFILAIVGGASIVFWVWFHLDVAAR